MATEPGPQDYSTADVELLVKYGFIFGGPYVNRGWPLKSWGWVIPERERCRLQDGYATREAAVRGLLDELRAKEGPNREES